MTAPHPSLPPVEWSRPMVHPQQSARGRVGRVVLVALLVGGWSINALGGIPLPGFSPTVAAQLDWSTLPWLAAIVLLVVGPQPRWATRWAWFWLLGAAPMAVVFLLVEPVPVWQTQALAGRPWRLTGGRAFLLMLAVGIVFLVLRDLVG